MIGINRSYTCMYPLVQRSLGLSMTEHVTNTYIYNTSYDDCFTINYEFEEAKGILQAGLFELMHRKYVDSGLLLETVNSKKMNKVAYTIKRPESLKETFKHFEKGEYSEFDIKYKYQIVTHLNSPKSLLSKQDAVVGTAILFKDPEYRDYLSEELGYTVPEDAELGSKPVTQDEMFDSSMMLEADEDPVYYE